jgi:hypothetical protein
MEAHQPTIYRITRKMANKLVPMLNKRDIYVENIQSYLDKEGVKRVARVNTLAGVSGVYVVAERKPEHLPHNILPYNEGYIKYWGPSFVYGNVIFVLGDKSYNALPDELKTRDEDLPTVSFS